MKAIIRGLKKERAALVAGLERVDAALSALTTGSLAGQKKTVAKARKRRRRKLTAAQRRAISVRMKKSWAARKKSVVVR